VGRFSAAGDTARCSGGDDQWPDGGDAAGDGVVEAEVTGADAVRLHF
jgi:hypothetical protein